MAKGILTAIGTLIIVVLILYLAYITTKYIGRGMGLKTGSRCMKIRDQIAMGRERSAAIVQIGTRFFLVGITASQVSLLSELDEEDLILFQDSETEDKPYPDFRELMDKIGRGKKKDE